MVLDWLDVGVHDDVQLGKTGVASALARNDHTLLAKSDPTPHRRGGGFAAVARGRALVTWVVGEDELVREK